MACEVIHKHYLAGRGIIVYMQDPQSLERFDRLLWGFEPTAFIPHALATDPGAADAPVLLTATAPVAPAPREPEKLPWLVNLDAACPPGAEQFERVLEIVSNRDEDKTAARQRWREYQQAGFSLTAHDLSGRP